MAIVIVAGGIAGIILLATGIVVETNSDFAKKFSEIMELNLEKDNNRRVWIAASAVYFIFSGKILYGEGCSR